MALGMPVAMSFGAGAIVVLSLYNVDPTWAVSQALAILSGFNFLALPAYILLGAIIGASGMAKRLSDFTTAVVGRLKGGLGIAIIMANGVFGAMSGSALSALAGMGKAFLPDMENAGYPKSYAIALMIPSAVLSCLIPPSGFMIIFGFLGELSIAKCFLAGAIPGIILMVFLIATHLVMSSRIPTLYIPPKVSLGVRFKAIAKTFYRNGLTLLIPVLVLGSIYGGFSSVVESAGLGVLFALIISVLIYRTLTIKMAGHLLVDVSKLVGSIFAIFLFFMVLSRVLIVGQVSDTILAFMLTISTNKWVLMAFLNILMLFMGMIMDDSSTCVVATIILLPIARAIGFNPYHFAAIATVNLELGLITPPVAPLLYLGGRIAGDMPLSKYVKPVLVFLATSFIPTLLITIFIPKVATFLPSIFSRGG